MSHLSLIRLKKTVFQRLLEEPLRKRSGSAGLAKFLGVDLSRASIISSATFAIICLFYVYVVAAYVPIKINILLDRVIYTDYFAGSIITNYLDQVVIVSFTILWILCSVAEKKPKITFSLVYGILLIGSTLGSVSALLSFTALSTVPFAVFLTILIEKRIVHSKKKAISVSSLPISLNYIIFSGLLIGIASLTLSIIHILYPGLSGPIENYEYEIYLVLSGSFSPFLLLLLLFCFPARYLAAYIQRIYRKRQTKRKRQASPLNIDGNSVHEVRSRVPRPYTNEVRILYLTIFVLLSMLLGLVPHLSTVNIDNQNVGTDSPEYVKWINRLEQTTNAQEFLAEVFVNLGADRPLSLLLLYLITDLVNTTTLVTLEHLPVILGPALVMAVYFLTRELFSNEKTSLIAAFLTAGMSFHLLVGIYAGFYANWIALIIGYLSIVFLFKYLKRAAKRNILLFFALLLMSQLCHVYTWSVLATVIAIFLVVAMVWNKVSSRRSAALLLMVVLATVAFDLGRTTISGSGGIDSAMAVAGTGAFGIERIETWWSNFILATQVRLGSVYGNFIILSLALYWAFRSNFKEHSNLFLGIFLTIGIIPVFFGDWVVQSRLIYNIPFQIPAAYALAHITTRVTGVFLSWTIYTWLLALSIRTLSNLYLIFPS